MDPWEQILIKAMSASGLVLAALAAYAYNRYKAAKESAKTVETLKNAQKNVSDATNGDPKEAGKSIVEKGNAAIPTLKDNIPNIDNLIKEITQKQTELTTALEKNQEIFEKLSDYLNRHRDDNTDALVKEEDLVNDGYETLADVSGGARSLKKSIAAATEKLSADIKLSNQVTSNTAKNNNQINETTDMKPNDDLLFN